jgi:hypothetical protein
MVTTSFVRLANRRDPDVEATQGGSVREVPIQIPHGRRFADVVATNDRWVVHFRTENTPATVNRSVETDTYFDVHPRMGAWRR